MQYTNYKEMEKKTYLKPAFGNTLLMTGQVDKELD